MLYIPFDDARQEMKRVLLTRGCPGDKAQKVSYELARNSLEGVYTHGINRFPRLVRNIDEGIVRLDVMPVKLHGFGAIENYDGQLGLGIVNAAFAMDRCIELAGTHGIGFVALRNTNHWLRAATYGDQACKAGMAAICFSNTMPNMPAWGAVDAHIGNNPLTIAFPREGGHVIVDMAMSQFSYGALEKAQLAGQQMPIDAGFDSQGQLTRDPAQVIASKRLIPTGYWKGSALSFLLDIFAGCMSLGNTVAGIGRLPGDEHGLSQVFMAINYKKIDPDHLTGATLEDAVADLLRSTPDEHTERIVFPGQRRQEIRRKNLADGIPVDERIWASVKALG